MFPAFTHELTDEETEEFESLLTHELPVSALGQFASQGAQFKPFTVETDTGQMFQVTLLPEQLGQVVNQDEPEKNRAFAVIVSRDEDKSWYVDPDEVDASTVLPELRQAFYESMDYSERDADYRYHFADGTTQIAVPSSDPVDRLDEELVFTAIEYIGGEFPQKFLLVTESGDYYYLRERSGSVRLIDDAGNGEEVFNAYVGREHPGTYLHREEVLNLISSVDYITIVDDYETEVPQDAHDEYWGELSDEAVQSDVDFDDLVVEGVDLDEPEDESE